jgi:hypothetical protein
MYDHSALHVLVCSSHSAMKVNVVWKSGRLSVETLCYKPKSRGFESRRGNLIFFNVPNRSSRTMALRLVQPVTEM